MLLRRSSSSSKKKTVCACRERKAETRMVSCRSTKMKKSSFYLRFVELQSVYLDVLTSFEKQLLDWYPGALTWSSGIIFFLHQKQAIFSLKIRTLLFIKHSLLTFPVSNECFIAIC